MRTPRATRPRMPGYGIPEDRKGLLPWKWARERLEKSHNYWISTVRPEGAPHTMVVWGLWWDGAFYFSTGKSSRKARNLAANPECVVCNEQAEEAVIVEGSAGVVENAARLKGFFRRFEKKYDWDMSTMQDQPVFEVRPRVAFGFFEAEYSETATRWLFED
jgi:pyridoxine/pyridoxamine 5'-phosphate oxidase